MRDFKISFAALALLCGAVGFTACSDDDDTSGKGGGTEPKIVVTPGETTPNTVSFTIAPENADKCAYVCLAEGAELPDAVGVMTEGVQLEKVETQLVTVGELTPETNYVVLAAVSAGKGAPVLSEQITLTTKKLNEGTTMEVTVIPVEEKTTVSSLTFSITTANAAECRYDFFKKSEFPAEPDPYDIFNKGKKAEVSSTKEYTVNDLDDDTEYVIVAVVEAADSYDKAMSEPVTMKTAKRDTPDNVDEQTFAEGELQVYSNGRNFWVKLTNEAYEVVLDLYDDASTDKAPIIPVHEYTFLKGAMNDTPWIAASTSKVTPVDGSAFTIEKGSVNVAYENGLYTITGSLISQDNRQLDIEFGGELPFPLKLDSGKTEKTENGYLASFTGSSIYGLDLEFLTEGKPAAGSYSIAAGTLSRNSAATNGTTKYLLAEAEIELSYPSETSYAIKGGMTTADGYLLTVDATIYSVTEPEEPGDAIVFTHAQGYVQDGGWEMNYSVDFENDEWKASFDLNKQGEIDRIPTGKYLYSSWAGGDIPAYRIFNKKDDSTIEDLDEGSIVVDYDESGKTYTVTIDIARNDGSSFKGSYEGPIEVEEYQGGYE